MGAPNDIDEDLFALLAPYLKQINDAADKAIESAIKKCIVSGISLEDLELRSSSYIPEYVGYQELWYKNEKCIGASITSFDETTNTLNYEFLPYPPNPRLIKAE